MVAQLDRLYVRLASGRALRRLVAYGLFEGRPVTTRGRWINPLVFAFAALAKRARRTRPVERPLFVVGTGRSGTSILGTILSLHPEVLFLNEPKALWHAIHGGEDVIGSYASRPGRLALDERDATGDVVRAAHRVFGACLGLTGARRVLDKYPELLDRIGFVRAIFPDARFVLLVRDGWASARSIAAWSSEHRTEHGGVVHDWWGVGGRKWRALVEEILPLEPALAPYAAELAQLPDGPQRAAVEWTLAMRRGLALVAGRADWLRLVRHEELARAPEETLASLLEFAELPACRELSRYAEARLVPGRAPEPFELPRGLDEAFRVTRRELGYPA